MTLSSIDLWQRISAAGLADDATCRRWAAEAARAMPASDALDGDRLLETLVEFGKLSRYQANVLVGKSEDKLRIGDYRLRGPVTDPVFSGWLEVAPVDSDPDALNVWWARWLEADALRALHPSAPSLKRVQQISRAQIPHLQKSSAADLQIGSDDLGDQGRQLLLRVAPVAGVCLSQQIGDKPPPRDVALEILSQMTDALAGLHQRNITHGRVFPDRIFWDGKQATLACDPLCHQTGTADQDSHGVFENHLQSLSNSHFLAPEFMAPGQTPNFSTDVYALGCTWWWLVTGKPFADGVDAAEIIKCQATGKLRSASKNPLPHGLQRVLEHAIAPNPNARFANGIELRQAFQACLTQSKRLPTGNPESSSTSSETSKLPLSDPSVKALAESAMIDQPTTPANKASLPSTESEKHQADHRSKQLYKPTDAATAATMHSTRRPAEREPLEPRTQEELKVRNKRGKKKPPHRQPQAKEKSHVSAKHGNDAATSSPSTDESKSHSSNERFEKAAVDKERLPSGQSVSSRQRAIRRRRSNHKWLIPVVGGCGFMIFLLLMLKFSGVLDAEPRSEETVSRPSYVPPKNLQPSEASTTDPRLDYFEVVDTTGDELWLPPRQPAPLDLSLLPPGAGLWVTIDSKILSNPDVAEIIQVDSLLPSLAESGVQLSSLLENLASGQQQSFLVVAAFYAPQARGDFPQVVFKVQLKNEMPLADLAEMLSVEPSGKDPAYWLGDGYAIYVASDEERKTQSAGGTRTNQRIRGFSLGTSTLIAETQSISGVAPPMLPAVERVLRWTDTESDFNLLVLPSFLFSEGRGIWKPLPLKFKEFVADWIERDVSAASLQMNFAEQWFIECRIAATSSRSAGRLVSELQRALSDLPATVESWMVATPAHPSWRALAVRFPQMLRVLDTYTRVGLEDGVLIANSYLPVDAAPNLLLASWLALQPSATVAGTVSNQAVGDRGGKGERASAWNIDKYLNRSISLAFDQEPIEEALRLVALEANDSLPAGVDKVDFELDGDAFELAGITRNQQLRDFFLDDRPVREVLTEIAKRGNPVTTVIDIRESDQKLIWLVKPNPEAPERSIITLTTREAAEKQQLSLPPEFAPRDGAN